MGRAVFRRRRRTEKRRWRLGSGFSGGREGVHGAGGFRTTTMNRRTDKLVRRTTMVATITASYFLLTADYGPEPNALDPIKKAILSAENRVKGFVFGSSEKPRESHLGNLGGSRDSPKEQP
ncbi:hypothetical protein NL676_011629 [Syzygium grande]|nr:hypothetical protein NL676_011629 [Syzygium grande]